MQANATPNTGRSRTARSRLSNGSSLHMFGDGRSAGARRFRDLVKAIADEAGGMAALSVTAQQVVRRLAMISVELEIREARRAAGEDLDGVDYCLMVNAQRRLLKEFRALVPKPKAPGFQERLRELASPREAAP